MKNQQRLNLKAEKSIKCNCHRNNCFAAKDNKYLITIYFYTVPCHQRTLIIINFNIYCHTLSVIACHSEKRKSRLQMENKTMYGTIINICINILSSGPAVGHLFSSKFIYSNTLPIYIYVQFITPNCIPVVYLRHP